MRRPEYQYSCADRDCGTSDNELLPTQRNMHTSLAYVRLLRDSAHEYHFLIEVRSEHGITHECCGIHSRSATCECKKCDREEECAARAFKKPEKYRFDPEEYCERGKRKAPVASQKQIARTTVSRREARAWRDSGFRDEARCP